MVLTRANQVMAVLSLEGRQKLAATEQLAIAEGEGEQPIS